MSAPGTVGGQGGERAEAEHGRDRTEGKQGVTRPLGDERKRTGEELQETVRWQK